MTSDDDAKIQKSLRRKGSGPTGLLSLMGNECKKDPNGSDQNSAPFRAERDRNKLLFLLALVANRMTRRVAPDVSSTASPVLLFMTMVR